MSEPPSICFEKVNRNLSGYSIIRCAEIVGRVFNFSSCCIFIDNSVICDAMFLLEVHNNGRWKNGACEKWFCGDIKCSSAYFVSHPKNIRNENSGVMF